MTDEEIMYHPKGTEDENEYNIYDEEPPEYYLYNSIPVIYSDGMLIFESEKQSTAYFEMINKKEYADKRDFRRVQKNTALRFKEKNHHKLPRMNKQKFLFRK